MRVHVPLFISFLHHQSVRSTTLITFVVLGKYLEHLVRGKTSDAMFALRDLQPNDAVLLQFDDNGNVLSEEVVDARLLKPGDKVKVSTFIAGQWSTTKPCSKVVPGAAFPCDGVIESGETTIDESMITGESLPVNKATGDNVIGSTVNQDGLV